MRHEIAQDLSPPMIHQGRSRVVYVVEPIRDDEQTPPYGVGMPDIVDGPGKGLATLIRDARARKGMRQDELADAAGISRQTIIQYESGKAVSPDAASVRAVLLVLDVDPREAPVALGYVTREEMGLPPKERLLDPLLEDIQRLLTDEKIPQRVRDNLAKGVKAARDLWLDMSQIRAPREPAAGRRRTPTAR
jgi:transcriptional regulator with XRE-family HTH domain